MAVAKPVGGTHFPRNHAELLAWFPSDDECRDYLEWLRWPNGVVCPGCESADGWRTREGLWSCAGCARKVSVTAGTIFDKTRLPLRTWFAAAWEITNQKTAGISAKGLQRALELGSYQTAWTVLHKYRSAMVRPGRELLTGQVEVDETMVGGSRPGRPGRGALGKVPVVVAVEVYQPRGFGRARLGVVPNASGATLLAFLRDTVEPGSTVITDGYVGYKNVAGAGYHHVPHNISAAGVQAHTLLPAVHRVASLFKRSVLNAYQQYPKLHLQAYCDEWVFRFNRRHSRSRGMLFFRLLELAVNADPLPYKDLVLSTRPRSVQPTPPTRPGRPRTPPINAARRPWRT